MSVNAEIGRRWAEIGRRCGFGFDWEGHMDSSLKSSRSPNMPDGHIAHCYESKGNLVKTARQSLSCPVRELSCTGTRTFGLEVTRTGQQHVLHECCRVICVVLAAVLVCEGKEPSKAVSEGRNLAASAAC